METTRVAPNAKPKASDVQVVVTGGQDTSAIGSPSISDADLKAAVESSLVKSAIFQTTKPSQATYRLDARIIEVSKPVIGFSFTVSLEIAWALSRTADSQMLFRKSIRTEHTTGALESFAGVTRLRMAIEGAARKNIDEMIQVLSDLNY